MTTTDEASSPSSAPDLSEPTSGGAGRFSGLLPDRWLAYRAPRWWQELGIIAVCYWLYGKVRNAVPDQESIAFSHAHSVQHLQNVLHLNFELSVNQFVAAHEWLAQVMDYYYATLHFVVTIGVLVWLFFWHPRIYRGARTILATTSLIALAGFYLYPLAPPRLLSGFGYVDTLLKFHTWGSLADPKIADHSNQFAAMPSLHIGWALWCGVSIAMCARRPWVRVLGAAYPVWTFLVIIGTANHFIIDAVAGVLTFAAAAVVQLLLSGHSAYTAAPNAWHRPSMRLKTPGTAAASDSVADEALDEDITVVRETTAEVDHSSAS